MININLYQPGQFDIDISFPQKWDELLPHEITYIAKQLFEELDAATARALILKYCIESRAKKPLPADWFLKLDAENMVIDVYPIIDFIFTSNDLTLDPEAIHIGNQKYHPQSWAEITCGEFEDAEVIATLFNEEPNPELLIKLSAILFRPKIKDEIELYLKYNPQTTHFYPYAVEKKLPLFAKVKPEILYANFIWYSGCRAQLPLMFKTVYEGDGSTSSEPDMMAFTKCIHSGAGVKNGSREKIRTTKLYEFMFEMEQEAIKNKEMKEEYERMQNNP